MNSKVKGNKAEVEILNILKDKGLDAERNQRISGWGGFPDVEGLEGIHIEVKRVEKLNIDTAMEQSIRDARADEMPTVFHRRNRKAWKVTMLLDDWIELYKKARK